MANELIVLEKLDIEAVFSDGGVDPIIEKLKKEAESFVPDLETATGRKDIASFAMKFAKTKTLLDGAGKELSAKYRAKIKPIDAERRKIRECCDDLKAKTRQPLTEWEDLEKERVENIKLEIGNFKICALSETEAGEEFDLAVLKGNLNLIKDIAITEEAFAEFASEAAVEKDMAVKKLERAIVNIEKREAETAELERLRKEAEERKAKEAADKAKREQEEREARIAKEAEERARLESELKAKEEAERVEREKAESEAEIARQKQARIDAEKEAERKAIEAKIEADRREKEAAQKERDRIAAEKKAEEDAAKAREADKAHKAKINNAAKDALEVCGLDCKQAKAVVKAIATGKIPHVSIRY